MFYALYSFNTKVVIGHERIHEIDSSSDVQAFELCEFCEAVEQVRLPQGMYPSPCSPILGDHCVHSKVKNTDDNQFGEHVRSHSVFYVMLYF